MISFRWSILVVSYVVGIQYVKFPTCPDAACIFPVDGAEFLTGAKFDIRVEIHDEKIPNPEFKVTIQSGLEGAPIPIIDYFQPKELDPQLERWNFTYAKDAADKYRALDGDESSLIRINVASKVWRNVSFKNAGNFYININHNNGSTHQVEWIVRPASCKRLAKNAIMFIADGTTINMITAARVMAKKQRNGKFFDKFEMDKMDHIGLIHTHALDTMMTDSSNSASAYHTGHKTAVHAIGVYPDSSPDPFDDPKQELLAELARRRSPDRGGKMAVGIVTTAEVQDATPAAVFAHTRQRGKKANIVHQQVYGADNGSEPVIADVFLGGGGKYFHNKKGSKSLNGQDYYEKYSNEFGYQIVTNRTELNNYSDDKPLLGIFHSEDMNVYVDRQILKENMNGNKASPNGDGLDATDQPGLVDMTKKALQVLHKRGGEAGFFAMIEAASPDKQMHKMDYHRSLVDIIEFDNAIKAAVEWARENDPSTLIVVTADHGHGFDVYGSVDTKVFNEAKDDDQFLSKRSAIGVYEDAGWPDYEDKDGDGYPDSLNVRTVFAAGTNNHPDVTENFQMNRTAARIPSIDTHSIAHKYEVFGANPDYATNGLKLPGNIPVIHQSAAHSMTDVGVFSSGPGSHLFAKVMDSTEVFFNFAMVLGLGEVDPRQCSKCLKRPSHY